MRNLSKRSMVVRTRLLYMVHLICELFVRRGAGVEVLEGWRGRQAQAQGSTGG